MAIIDFPSQIRVATIAWTQESNHAALESPFTGQMTTIRGQLERWRFTCEMRPLSRENASAVQGFFMQLEGQANLFRMSDPAHPKPLGHAAGLPALAADHAAGARTLSTDGWAVNVHNQLRAGDWIQIGEQLCKVTADVHSDVDGLASISIWPMLWEDHAIDELVIVRNATGLFRMIEDRPSWEVTSRDKIRPLSFRLSGVQDVYLTPFPYAAALEPEAYRHWLFGLDNPLYRSLTGIIGAATVIGEETPVLSDDYVTLKFDPSLGSGYFKANEFTVFVTAKRTFPDTGIGYFGNRTGGTDGLGIATPTATADLQARWLTGTGNLRLVPWLDPEFNGWFCAGYSIRADGVTLYCPQCNPTDTVWTEAVAIANTVPEYIIGPRGAAGSGVYGADTADIAEVILFERALTSEEMQAVYARSVIRMAARGITLT